MNLPSMQQIGANAQNVTATEQATYDGNTEEREKRRDRLELS